MNTFRKIPNKYEVNDDYVILKIHSPTHGDFETVIDKDDFERIRKFHWSVCEYNTRSKTDIYYVSNNGVGLLHRFILNTPKGFVTDHIDGDTMNNRKENLRFCEPKNNVRKAKIGIDNTSGYLGVTWNKNENKWMAYIRVDYKFKNLGYFTDLDDAVKARQNAVEKYFGEYAPLRDRNDNLKRGNRTNPKELYDMRQQMILDIRELFIKRMTVDSIHHDKRKRDFNQAIFMENGNSAWSDLDMDMVLQCFDNAIKDLESSYDSN